MIMGEFPYPATPPTPSAAAPDLTYLLTGRRRILVTGGAGFIRGAVVPQLLQVVLIDAESTAAAMRQNDPDLVMQLADGKHVDRSIEGPGALIDRNVTSSFHLVQAERGQWKDLGTEVQPAYRYHHISTDRVLGFLVVEVRFSPTTSNDTCRPYSASKPASDFPVKVWQHSCGVLLVLNNCSNNDGPWQFPEKLIPVLILKGAVDGANALYGDGRNVVDSLYQENNDDALRLESTLGQVSRLGCVAGHGEHANKHVVETNCQQVDELRPHGVPNAILSNPETDRTGHFLFYTKNTTRISSEPGSPPCRRTEDGLAGADRMASTI
jgi:dTDP-glucose 4,6-dehydratase